MSYHPAQFRAVIQQTLKPLPRNLFSEDAVELLFGTAAHESKLGHFLKQYPTGPGTGCFQVELKTEFDIWENFISYRPDLSASIFLHTGVTSYDPWQLQVNLAYQIIMARLQYYRAPGRLPGKIDIMGMAEYWDKYYNKNPDKGFPVQWKRDYLAFR